MPQSLRLLCSCLLCAWSAACGSRQTRDGPDRGVSDIVAGWESGAEIDDSIDPRRGLLVLRFCAPAGEATPSCEPSTYLHCGESLRRATAVLREDLEMRQNYTQGSQVYACGVDECHHPPMMEYDYEGTLRFDTSVEPPVLIEVLHVEGLNAAPESLASWAQAQRLLHRTQRCTEGSG